MTFVRLVFYALYVVLGAVILVRTAGAGAHWETLPAWVLGAALMALGLYRIRLYLRMRASSR